MTVTMKVLGAQNPGSEQVRRRSGHPGALAVIFAIAFALAPCLSAGTGDADTMAKGSDAAPTALALTAQGDSISVNISGVPFSEVLDRLAEQTNIEVFVVADTMPDEDVSAVFENLPLETALRELLGTKSYVLRYAQDSPSSAPKIAAVYIVPQGSEGPKANRILQVGKQPDEPPEMDADVDTVLLEAEMTAEDAAKRAAALKKYLAETEDPDHEAVANALNDPDPKVREVALEAYDNLHLPADATAVVALNDPQPSLRMQALEILVAKTGEAAQDTIRQALLDPDPAVQAHAEKMAKLAEALKQWEIMRDAEIAAEQNAAPKSDSEGAP